MCSVISIHHNIIVVVNSEEVSGQKIVITFPLCGTLTVLCVFVSEEVLGE